MPSPPRKGRSRSSQTTPIDRLELSEEDEFPSADSMTEKEVDWLNKPFFPFGSLVIIDGDPGQGKSVITTGMVARSASGKPALPFGYTTIHKPIHCGMIGAEDDIEQAVLGRLRVAGYVNNKHVWFMRLGKDEKGHIEQLTFPSGTDRVRKFITRRRLRLLIIDPISSFVGESIHTHNEASVRSALAPLAEIARATGCCIVLVRHLNKDGSMKALYRGTGSIAFSAIARSGIITGECEDGSFGLAQVKCSYAERFWGVVRYTVEQSDSDPGVAVVEWGERDYALTADDIAKGPGARKGPEPEVQEAIRKVLEPMFEERDTWPERICHKALEDAGVKANHKTITKVKNNMNLRSVPNREKTGWVNGWSWTSQEKPRSRRESPES